MNTPPPNLVGLVERAAELRASGQSWEQVAKAIHRKVATIRGWPARYGDYWNRLLAGARRVSVESAGDEARAFLRVHLRSKEDASSRDAAKQLIHHQTAFAKTESPPAPSDLYRFVEMIEGLTDAELSCLLQELRADYDEAALRGSPGELDPAGAA